MGYQSDFSWRRVAQMKSNQKYFHFYLMLTAMVKSVSRKFFNLLVSWKPTIEMKQFLAIHHLKRTGDFPKASDQEELEDVMQKIFSDTDEMTVDEFLKSDHGMITMVTFNLM